MQSSGYLYKPILFEVWIFFLILSSSLISLSSNDVAMGAPPPPPIDFDVEAFEQQQRDMETTPSRTRAPRRPRAPGKYFIFS